MDEADPSEATYPDDSLIAALQRAKMEGGGVTKERFNLGWLEGTGSKRGRSQTTGNTLVS